MKPKRPTLDLYANAVFLDFCDRYGMKPDQLSSIVGPAIKAAAKNQIRLYHRAQVKYAKQTKQTRRTVRPVRGDV